MKIIKVYPRSISGKLSRKYQEWKLFRHGYSIVSEEDVKEFNSGKGCFLLILFPPLVLFGRTKKIKVTYERQ